MRGCTVTSLPSRQPSSTRPKAKAFSKQPACVQTTGAPSFFVATSFRVIFFLTTSFSEVLYQVTIKSHPWHFISRTSRFCVLVLSLLQKAGSGTSISQATLLPGDSLVSPYSLQDSRASCTGHILFTYIHAPYILFSKHHCPL